MKLSEALTTISYDDNWVIYSDLVDGRFNLDAPARIGQAIFENGGLLDDMIFVCRGTDPSDYRVEWVDGGEDEGDWDDGFMEYMLDRLNSTL